MTDPNVHVLCRPKWSKKWHIPILCFVITLCNTVIIGYAVMADINDSDWGSAEKKAEIFDDFITVRSLLVSGAALVMIWFGYRVSAVIGSILLAMGLLIPTFLDGDDANAIGFCIAGLAGTGTAFLKLSALVPVIEYFEKGRMWAIVVVSLGEVIGLFIVLGTTLIDGIKIETEDLYWKELYRYLLIPTSIAFCLSFGLKPLDLRLEKCSLKRIIGVEDWDFFKSLTLIAIITMAFLNSLGKNLVDVSSLITDSENNFNQTEKIVGPFTPIIGQIIGLFVLFIWSKCSKRKVTTLLGILICVNFVAGLFTIPAGHYIGQAFGLLAFYGVLFGISLVVFENCLDDDIPNIFGNTHVRLMEGIIGLAVGTGEILAEKLGDKITEDQAEDADKVTYYTAGIFMWITIVFAGLAMWRQRENTISPE